MPWHALTVDRAHLLTREHPRHTSYTMRACSGFPAGIVNADLGAAKTPTGCQCSGCIDRGLAVLRQAGTASHVSVSPRGAEEKLGDHRSRPYEVPILILGVRCGHVGTQ